ncbi:MAG: nucleoside-diphosphate sugar epimerase/dehydratase [Bacteroidaceae bacterium]
MKLFNRYLNYRIVWLIDESLSLLSTFVAYLLIGELMQQSLLPQDLFVPWLGISVIVSALSFYVFRTYRSVIRHATLNEMWKIAAAVFCKSLLLIGALLVLQSHLVSYKEAFMYIILDTLLTLGLLVFVRVSMIVLFDYIRSQTRKNKEVKNLLIYSCGTQGVSLITYLSNSTNYRVKGFLSYGKRLRHQRVAGNRVFYFETRKDIEFLCKREGIDALLFETRSLAIQEERRLVQFCTDCKIRLLLSSSIEGLEHHAEGTERMIREVKIEDLLGREEIKISMDEIVENFRGKTIMVTGGAGSIGSELCRQLATFGIQKLILFDNAETPMHNIRLELEETFPELQFVPVIGDVRQTARLDFAFRAYHPQVVFHAAAYKHVPLMEENPCEAVLVNIIGTRNVADYCIRYGSEKMVMISTDKAVNPTNVMGCSKRMAEIYVQSLGQALEQGEREGKTQFVTTRFGNVLGSNGSVIPRFREQIEKGGPVTVTHPDITRFFMTIPEACRLVMEAATMSAGNQIFVFDMGESVKIANLAKRMIELAGFKVDQDIKIEYTGLRPGEKLYEEVLASTEGTVPTEHEKIRIANVRSCSYAEAQASVETLEKLSRAVEIPQTVRFLKKVVPEFKSKNSKFEAFDKIEETGT